MRRRAFIAGLGGVAVRPLTATSQTRRRIVAILMPYPDTDAEVQRRVAAFRGELQKAGWSDDLMHFEARWSTDNLDRLRADAAELVKLNPDVIFLTGGRVVPIIQQQTRSIPTVFAGVSAPLGQGFVSSLAKPGGNLTGIALPPVSITAKLVEILKEVAPSVTRAALVFNPANPSARLYREEFEAAAPSMSLKASVMPVHDLNEVAPAFENFAREPGGGLILPSDLTLLAHRELVVSLAARNSLPTIYSDRAMVVTGGLASYSADRTEMFRLAAGYVDRILRGERAGELPIQEPMKFEFVINLRTAHALGITMPAHLVARADEVIE